MKGVLSVRESALMVRKKEARRIRRVHDFHGRRQPKLSFYLFHALPKRSVFLPQFLKASVLGRCLFVVDVSTHSESRCSDCSLFA